MNLALLSKIMNYNASLIQLLLKQCRQLWLNLPDFRQYKHAGRQRRHQRFVFCSHDWHVLLKKKERKKGGTGTERAECGIRVLAYLLEPLVSLNGLQVRPRLQLIMYQPYKHELVG